MVQHKLYLTNNTITVEMIIGLLLLLFSKLVWSFPVNSTDVASVSDVCEIAKIFDFYKSYKRDTSNRGYDVLIQNSVVGSSNLLMPFYFEEEISLRKQIHRQFYDELQFDLDTLENNNYHADNGTNNNWYVDGLYFKRFNTVSLESKLKNLFFKSRFQKAKAPFKYVSSGFYQFGVEKTNIFEGLESFYQ